MQFDFVCFEIIEAKIKSFIITLSGEVLVTTLKLVETSIISSID